MDGLVASVWAVGAIALYSTGHWIGGTICLVILFKLYDWK